MFNTTNLNATSQRSKKFLGFLFCISKIYIKFWIIFKKTCASEVICFWNYRLQKAPLRKCLNSFVSEDSWTVNILKGLKHCLKLESSIFVIFFNHSGRKSVRQSLSYQYIKSWDCLLTYWHPMTSILSQ